VTTPDVRPSRQREILDLAAELFARRGYHNVSVKDIGEAVGISGPALYKHFSSKNEILVQLFEGAADGLLRQAQDITSTTVHAHAALAALVQNHVAFALAHRWLIALFAQESQNLPTAAGRRNRLSQRRYIGEWIHTLGECRPELAEYETREMVLAAMAVIHSSGGYRSGLPDHRRARLVERLALAVLEAPLSDGERSPLPAMPKHDDRA
jgi:AcrR family transcriptional regulator